MQDVPVQNDPVLLTKIWEELSDMKTGVYTKVDKVTTLVEHKLAEHDKRLVLVEKEQGKQSEQIDTLFEADISRRRDVLKVVAQRDADAEALRALAARVAHLEQQLLSTQRQGEITHRTQHDDYSRAFSRSADFENVFLFLLTFGYNTLTGQTCVVFRVVQDVLCVCVNLRALHVIAKLKLNYAQVTKAGKLPPFALFRLNLLQKLFRDAKLPEKDLDKSQVDSLFKRVGMKPMKTPAAKRASWVALEAEPFVFAVNNLTLSDKLSQFSELFSRHYPSQLSLKPVSDKDNCYTVKDVDQLPSDKTPLFQVPYWSDLFYKSMRDYRKLLSPEDPCDEDCHFLTLYEVEYDVPIGDSFEDVASHQSNKRAHSESDLEEDPPAAQGPIVAFKRRRSA